MSIKQQIDQIIKSRKEKAVKLEEQQRYYKDLLNAFKSLKRKESSRFEVKDDTLRVDYTNKIKALELVTAIKLTEEVINSLDDVINRYRREYISIATIGKERQGKSRFLQSVSQLDDRVIPAYSGTSCTGATSVIWNDSSIPEGQLKAVIAFKKRSDMVDLVREYVSIIKPGYPINEIDFDTIGDLPLNMLSEATGTDAVKQTSYSHLKKIVIHFSEFSDLFDSPAETFTDPEIIKRMVAQNNGLAIDDPNSEQYYNYLAVAKADIYCRFFYDAGKIRLIDTVGIESTQLGVAQAMLDTVKTESDAAIVVNRPIADPQVKDVEIYTDITRFFADKTPDKWLFYLVNHVEGQNDNTVAGFDKAISSWGIAGHMIVNCGNPDDVNKNFMVPMLNTLLSNIDDIDQNYLDAVEDKRQQLNKVIDIMIMYIGNLSDDNVGGIQGIQALEKGKLCFNKIGAQLRKVVNHYAHERHEPNYILWNETQKILNNLDAELNPGAEAIQKIADSNNVIGGDVWNIVLHYVRNEITRRFSEIDDELTKENIRFKNSLVEVLYSNLKELFGDAGDVNDDSVDLTSKLREMMDKTIAGNPKYAQIYDAIVFLDNFQFNTRATLIQTVRVQLSIINPLCREYANTELVFYAGNCGEEIEYFLTSRLSLIEENLRHALMSIYSTPNEAFFAVAEEFYDRLTFAVADLSTGTIVNMSDIWGMFFQEYSHIIWKEQVNDIRMLNELSDEIRSLLPLLKKCEEVK